MSTKQRFLKFIQDKQLISNGDGIVVGLSGGPDSVCLLNLLCEIREEMNIDIVACHINHMIRGEAADDDEYYSKQLCERKNVRFYSKRIDVNKYAKESGQSSETAGRRIRYDFFNEIMKQNKFNKIATAHNANDQAETIIMRMMRGAGLEGLTGIPVKRDGVYIRPILFLKREEIEEYCNSIGENPHIDATNLERVYSRNKVRLDIIPYMRENFNPDIIDTINRMGLLIQEDNNFIELEAERYYNRFVEECKNKAIIKKDAFKLHSAISNRIIRRAISYVSGNKYDLELKHIESIRNLGLLGTNKRVDLPESLYAINVYNDIEIKLKSQKDKKESITIEKGDILLNSPYSFQDYSIEFELLDKVDFKNLKSNKFVKYFDFDKIDGIINIRNRQNGDKIIPLGMKGSKKVKDIFIDMKIPQERRDYIPIMESNNEIFWIVGVKLSDKFKVDDKTTKILKIEVKEDLYSYQKHTQI